MCDVGLLPDEQVYCFLYVILILDTFYEVMGHFTARSLHSLKPSVTSQPIQSKLNLNSVTSQPIIYLCVATRVLIYELCCEFVFFYRSRCNKKL